MRREPQTPPKPGNTLRSVLGIPVSRLGLDALRIPTDDEVRAALAKDICPRCYQPLNKLLPNGRIGATHDPTKCPIRSLRLLADETEVEP